MLLIDMSADEKEVFKKDIEIALVKKWWPLVTFMFFFGLFIMRGTNWFDNNVATKTDIERIETKLNQINNSLVTYASSNEAVHATLHRRIDSLGHIVSLSHRSALTARRDKYGNVTFQPYSSN